MILLPFIAQLLLFLLLRRVQGLPWKQAFIRTQIIFFLFVAVTTEALSAVRLVERPIITPVWIAALIVLAALLINIKPRKTATAVVDHKPLGLVEWLSIACLCAILSITLVIALVSPPNTVDSMTYHMTKVAHWIQDRNINFFATSNGKQNYLAPLSEYTVLHFQLLANSDRFANIVQWMSFVGCIVTVALLIEDFGGSRSTQYFGVILAATIPMAILQSSSTQTDLVVSFLILAFTYLVRQVQKSPSWENAIMCGLALGCGMLAKGTIYVFAGPFAAVCGVLAIWNAKTWAERKRVVGAFSLVVVLAVALNASFWHRTYSVYGELFPPRSVKNENKSPAAIWSIGLRNISLHFTMPSKRVRWYTYRIVQKLGGKTVDDPATSFRGMPFAVSDDPYQEGTAGNLIHLILAFGAAALLITKVGSGKTELRYYAGSVLVGAILFTVLLKWQLWASRLQLPLFFLAVPFTAIVFWECLSSRWAWLKWLVVAVVVVWCVPYVFKNQTRPIIPTRTGEKSIFESTRKEAYFAGTPDLYDDFTQAVDLISKSHPEKVGFYMGHNDPEYLVWMLMGKAAVSKPPTFMHVGVTEESKPLQSKAQPEFIFVTHKLDTQTFNDATYKVVFQGTSHNMLIGSNLVQVLQKETVASPR
jgi:hypothetical protein